MLLGEHKSIMDRLIKLVANLVREMTAEKTACETFNFQIINHFVIKTIEPASIDYVRSLIICICRNYIWK